MVANAPQTTRRRRRSIAAALTCLVTAVAMLLAAGGASARTAACPHAATPIHRATHRELVVAVDCLVNVQRVDHHLPRLVPNRKLDRSAQRWTDEMVADREFSHGYAFSSRISAVGFDWTDAGENIATGYTTPKAVVRAWMHSPGHCANILDPQFREVGTGVLSADIRNESNVRGTWTQDFGRLMGQRALSGNFGPAHACYR